MKNIVLIVLLTASPLSRAQQALEKNLEKLATPANVTISATWRDVKILKRATQILSGENKWDQHDTRVCPSKQKTYSLYCALYHASLDVHSKFDHRAAALEETRRTVEQFTQNKTYEHRLMNYNNDTSTTFADIKKVLATTEARLIQRLKK